MNKVKDVEGNEIQEGDLVWFATTGYGQKAILIKGAISKFTDGGNVKVKNLEGDYSHKTYISSRPEQQIALIESRTRKVLFEKEKI